MRTRMLPLPKIGGLPPPSAPRLSLDSSNHNKSPPCYCPLTPVLPEYTEHICLVLHTTVLQISGDPTPPPPSLDKINTSSPSAMPQSLWLPGPLPSKELFLSPHPSGPRTQHKDSPGGLTSTSFAWITEALDDFSHARSHITCCLGSKTQGLVVAALTPFSPSRSGLVSWVWGPKGKICQHLPI